MPISFHTVPAVSLTQACFTNNQYEHNAFQKCFSNLLGVGFRKFVVDTYWDPLRKVWSLCPVELPRSNEDSSNDGDVPVETGPVVVPSSDTLMADIPLSTIALPPGAQKRQETSAPASASASSFAASSSVVLSLSSSPTLSSSTSAATPTIIDFPNPNGPPLLQIGSYNCTSLTTLGLLTGILEDFLETTATTTGAALILFSFNINAASSLTDPDAPAPYLSQDQLPGSEQRLSSVLQGNLSDDIYRPSSLSDQRANLDSSWYNVDWNNLPLEGYFEDSTNADGNVFTRSGWPTEAYMEFQDLYRLVASYGTVAPQMGEYKIEEDSDYIFPPRTLMKEVATSIGTDGRVTSGCLFNPSDDTIHFANSSWAISSAPQLDVSGNPDLLSPIPSINNITACGITPLLNQTLAGTTADKNPLPYAEYVHSTLWSFAPGQPLNTTSEDDSNSNRCVVMMKSPYPSRWRVSDCRESHRVACHDPSEPYNWIVSSSATTYDNADSYCAPPYRFSVPHTALENSHLFSAFQSATPDSKDTEALYVNLNSIGTPDCWVVGKNGTCPYLPTTETDRTKIVVVPTVAAVIIFLMAAMTFFVKCAANRRENKRGRKRRLVGGWEYEGVPS